MRKSEFKFKQFSCSHCNSTMKIGVDAVILGAWADVEGARHILDVGTGCGVIALMCAQRNHIAVVKGIDIDEASVTEANSNFRNSEWSNRLHAELISFDEVGEKYDLIVSNPPFFDSGVENPQSRRESARHQASLSPKHLLQRAKDLLLPNGKLVMIFPAEQLDDVRQFGASVGISLHKALFVSGRVGASPKRVVTEFHHNSSALSNLPYKDCEIEKLSDTDYVIERIAIEASPGVFTDKYIDLCRDFYLKF